MIKNHPQAQEALDKGYVEIIHQYREVKNGFSSSGKKNVENAIHEKINLVCIKRTSWSTEQKQQTSLPKDSYYEKSSLMAFS